MTPLITGLKIPHAGVLAALQKILEDVGVTSCRVTSVSRTPAAQAQAMYNNCANESLGVALQYRTYKNAGDQVVAVYEANRHLPEAQVVKLMEEKICEVGPANVSHHILPPDAPIMTIDIAENSIPEAQRKAFWVAASTSLSVAKILHENNVFHLEIRKAAVPTVQTT